MQATTATLQLGLAQSQAPQLEEQAEQSSLFDLNTFAAPTSTDGKQPRRKADIQLPQERQLDLFSRENQVE